VSGWRKRQIKEHEMTDKVAQEKALQALHSENERLGLYKDAYAEQEPVAWTLLLTGEHTGMVGMAGEKFVGAPDYYQRVNVYTRPPQRIEQNFCSRCGKRTKDIHTCTPPKENT
jgi:hypothetical protein